MHSMNSGGDFVVNVERIQSPIEARRGRWRGILGANSQPVLRIVKRPRSPSTCDPDAALLDVIRARSEGAEGLPRVRHELILPGYGSPHIPLANRTDSGPVQVREPEAEAAADENMAFAIPFRVGDRVTVRLAAVDESTQTQTLRAGWNERLAKYVGRVGVIHQFTAGGDATVLYGDRGESVTVDPAALARAAIGVGDVVRINGDAARVEAWQRSQGGWDEYMIRDLGKLGTVVEIWPDGDLEVEIEGHSWKLNPRCVKVTNHSSAS